MRDRRQVKDWISWSLKAEGNPYILKSEIEAAKNQLPASIFAQEYEAVVEDEQRWQWAFDKTVWESFGVPFFEWMGFSVGERPRPCPSRRPLLVSIGCRWVRDDRVESEQDDGWMRRPVAEGRLSG